MLVLAIKALLKRHIDSVEFFTWTTIERDVAADCCVWIHHVILLRKGFLEDGDIYVFGEEIEEWQHLQTSQPTISLRLVRK